MKGLHHMKLTKFNATKGLCQCVSGPNRVYGAKDMCNKTRIPGTSTVSTRTMTEV